MTLGKFMQFEKELSPKNIFNTGGTCRCMHYYYHHNYSVVKYSLMDWQFLGLFQGQRNRDSIQNFQNRILGTSHHSYMPQLMDNCLMLSQMQVIPVGVTRQIHGFFSVDNGTPFSTLAKYFYCICMQLLGPHKPLKLIQFSCFTYSIRSA